MAREKNAKRLSLIGVPEGLAGMNLDVLDASQSEGRFQTNWSDPEGRKQKSGLLCSPVIKRMSMAACVTQSIFWDAATNAT